MSLTHAASLSRLENEIATQTRLSNLYQQSRDELRNELTALANSREQMQQTLNQALARQEEMEASANHTINKLRDELAEAQRNIDELSQSKDELARQVQQLREELQDVPQIDGGNYSMVPRGSGAAAAADGAALSVTHTTTTSSMNVQIGHAELYAKYLSALEQLRTEKHESRLIEQYLQQIQREISEKAPMIEQQRFAYNKLITLNTNLTEKMQQAQADTAHLQQEYAKISKQRESDLGELAHARQECDDLARQVRSLLRGKSQVSGDLSTLSAQSLISESLVEVDDVEDVQRQNQKLLSVVRELSKQNEEMSADKQRAEQQAEEERQTRQSQELRDAYDSIEQLKSQRKSLEIRLEALLHSASLQGSNGSGSGGEDSRMVVMDPQSLATATAGGVHGNPSATASLLADLQQQMRDKTASFEQSQADWQRERTQMQQSLLDAQNQLVLHRNEHSVTVQQLSGTLDQARSQHSEVRMNLAKVQSEFNAYQQLYAELKARNAESTRELDAMRSRANTLNDQLIANQKQIQQLQQERSKLDDSSARLTAENASLQASLSLASKSASRYATENSELSSQLQHLNTLMASLQQMQTLMESKEQVARDSLVSEKEQLRLDWVSMKQQLDEERRNAREVDKHAQSQLSELRAKIELKQSECHSTKEQFIESRTLLQTSVARVAQLEGDLRAAQDSLAAIHSARQKEQEQRESMLAGTGAPALTNEQQLELQVQKLQAELAENVSLVAEQKTHISNLSALSLQTEKELESLTLDSRLYRLKSDKELAELRASKSTLTSRIEKLAADLKQNELDNAAVIDQLHQQTHALEAQLRQSESEKKNSEKISGEYVANLAKLQGEIGQLAEAARENQAKYEQELTNHSRTVQDLSAKRQENVALTSSNAALASEAGSLRLQVQTLTDANAKLQTELNESTTAFQSKLAAAQHQHELLYGQLELLGIQLKRVAENQAIEGILAAGSGSGASKPAPSLDEPTGMELEGASAATAAAPAAAASAAASASQLTDLRDIIKFLRSEKEELAIQYERQLQLQSRSENQIEQLRKETQELKDELSSRVGGAAAAAAGASAPTTAAEHSRLLSQLNQLHILEESNSMLRDESNRAALRARELQSSLTRLEASVNPLKARIDELESERAVLESDLAALRLENSRWSGRYQKLLNQSEFIDPEVHNLVREELAKAKAELDTLQADKVRLEGELAALKEAQAAIQAERDSFEARFNKMKGAATHWKTKFEEATKEAATLEANFRTQLEEAKAQSAIDMKNSNTVKELAASEKSGQFIRPSTRVAGILLLSDLFVSPSQPKSTLLV